MEGEEGESQGNEPQFTSTCDVRSGSAGELLLLLLNEWRNLAALSTFLSKKKNANPKTDEKNSWDGFSFFAPVPHFLSLRRGISCHLHCRRGFSFLFLFFLAKCLSGCHVALAEVESADDTQVPKKKKVDVEGSVPDFLPLPLSSSD